jgi:hypothetical protein
LNEVNDNEEPEKAEACFIDPDTGQKSYKKKVSLSRR